MKKKVAKKIRKILNWTNLTYFKKQNKLIKTIYKSKKKENKF